MQQKVNTARSNLLVLTILTAVNILILLIGSPSMLLFSATVPYYAVAFGYFNAGGILLALAITIALICITLYLMCWVFSKDHYGWFYAAFAMMLIDTVFQLVLYISSNMLVISLDTIIHVWIIWCMFSGGRSGSRLAGMPEEEVEAVAVSVEAVPEWASLPAEEAPEGESQPAAPVWGKPLRMADTDKKYREFISAEHNGHRISYRRTGRVNELVIDGYVYDEVTMLFESTHNLTATVDGHRYEAGFDGISHSYLKADGVILERKLRIY